MTIKINTISQSYYINNNTYLYIFSGIKKNNTLIIVDVVNVYKDVLL